MCGNSVQKYQKNKVFLEGEEKYRQLFNQMLNGYALHEIICDDQGQPIDYRFLDVNPAFERLTGLKAESIVGHTVLEVLPQTELSWIEKYGKVALTGEPINFEDFSIEMNRYFEVTAFCTGLNQFACSFIDITERKKLEELLRESEIHFRSIVENSEAGYFFIDKDGIIQDVNHAWIRLYRYDSAEEILGQHFAVIQKIDDLDFAKEFVEGIMRNDSRYLTGEFSRKCKDGSIGYHSFSARSVSRAGEVIGVEGFIVDTTEHKQDEVSLAESEKRYKLIFENAGDVIFINDEEGRILKTNELALKLYGYTYEEITGMTIDQMDSPEEVKYIPERMEKLMREGHLEFETIHRRKDGSFFPIEVRARRIKWEEKPAIISVCHDITERKVAEVALRESEHRYQRLAENSPDLIYRMSLPEGKYEYISPAATVLSGRSPEEWYNKPSLIWEIIHPDWRSYLEEQWENLLKGHVPPNYEFQIIHTDESIRWVNQRNTLVKDEDGYPIAIEGIVTDITQRRQAELALVAEKERLRVTLCSITDGVITTDINGNVTFLNKVAEELTGWNLDEAFERPLSEVFDIINEHTLQQSEEPAKIVVATGEPMEFENHFCLITKDGCKIIISGSSALIHDTDSQSFGVVIVFRDMTEKQKLEDAIQKSQKLESLGVIAGGIAHDFNNILTIICGYIELSIDETVNEQIQSYLGKSSIAIDRARFLTQQLVTFAKGGAPIKKVANLFPFVQKITQFALSGSSILCKFQIQENLWACDFDKNQIGQVVDNLIINAQQAMPNGGTIKVLARNITLTEKEHPSLDEGNYVKLSIIDQGVGIPKESLLSIFDPYYSTKAKENGLGLSTCYSIVNRHCGGIDVESELGKGSTFHIYIPAFNGPIPTIKEE